MRFVYLCGSLQPADAEAMAHVATMTEGHELELSPPDPKQRTPKQNRSMWKYCAQIAENLNDAGLDMRSFPYRHGLQLPWTKDSVMTVFWRPIQDAMFDKASTRDLTTVDMQSVYKAMDKALSERVGVRAEWPSLDSQAESARDRELQESQVA